MINKYLHDYMRILKILPAYFAKLLPSPGYFDFHAHAHAPCVNPKEGIVNAYNALNAQFMTSKRGHGELK